MGELKFAFKRFALMTKFMIFANADDKNTMDVMYTLDRRVRTFGIQNDGDYQALNVNEYKPGFFEFDLKEWNKVTGHIRLAVPGYHNIYNALAMCAVCRFVGLTVEQCADAALNFKGAGRRFEVYGECNGALVVDDYAHHPTELRATLNTAKEMGYKRLIAVHQPFTYSRTKMLFNDFVDVLKIPDITVLTPIMGSREPNDPTITSAKLAAQIPGSVLVNSLEEAAEWVKQNAREGDLVITLGCGDIYKASKMMVADPLPLLHVPLLLQATGQFIAHGLQCLQSALVLPHLRTGKHGAVQILPRHRLRGGGQLFGLPGQEAPGPVGAPHHCPYQQQNAQNAVHGLHIRQHAPQRRVGVGHGIVKLQQANRSVLQFRRHIILCVAKMPAGFPLSTPMKPCAVRRVSFYSCSFLACTRYSRGVMR